MCVRPPSHPPQVNGVLLQSAEHHVAVEALRGSGSAVSMTVLRERMVEPENAITVTPLRPEDDYSPRERRGGGLHFPEQPEGAAPTERLSACLMRSERGLGFSIAGGKGSTPYRPGDMVSSGQGFAEGGLWPKQLAGWRHLIPAIRAAYSGLCADPAEEEESPRGTGWGKKPLQPWSGGGQEHFWGAGSLTCLILPGDFYFTDRRRGCSTSGRHFARGRQGPLGEWGLGEGGLESRGE